MDPTSTTPESGQPEVALESQPREASHEEAPARRVRSQKTRTRTRARSQSSEREGGGAVLFLVIGWLALLGGIGLAVGARFSEPMAQAAAELTNIGLPGGVLCLGGLLLVAMGMMRKSVSARRGEHGLLLEQVTADLIDVRGAVDALKQDSYTTNAGMQHVVGQLDAVHQVLTEAQSQPERAREALFRLAASLDKMGARVEQNMNARFEAFTKGLEALGQNLVQAEGQLTEVLSDVPRMLQAQTELKQVLDQLPAMAAAQARVHELVEELPRRVDIQLDANLEELRSDLPALIRNQIDAEMTTTRGELASDLRTQMDKVLGELEETRVHFASRVQEQIAEHMERTRRELGETIEARLAHALEQAPVAPLPAPKSAVYGDHAPSQSYERAHAESEDAPAQEPLHRTAFQPPLLGGNTARDWHDSEGW